ncbi:hypothetical protein VNO78_18954 [Psophocarpus tetragonolobus]|uniref:Uncharacterized protein n=1 Tax=Psophocarpus tetragonolobus TaxID=3891 RepID=A0AAN9XFZ5_PSOTE
MPFFGEPQIKPTLSSVTIFSSVNDFCFGCVFGPSRFRSALSILRSRFGKFSLTRHFHSSFSSRHFAIQLHLHYFTPHFGI